MSNAPTHLDKTFRDILESHLGKEFTIINPESYEETGIGHRLQADWYPAKLVAIGTDFVVLVLRFQHGGGKSATTEPVEQYIPIQKIKRLSLMKSERFLHL